MDPLLDVASSLHLLAGGERSYLAVPKTSAGFLSGSLPIAVTPVNTCSTRSEHQLWISVRLCRFSLIFGR